MKGIYELDSKNILIKIADLKKDAEVVAQFGERCECGKKLRYGYIVFNIETEEYKIYGSECIQTVFNKTDKNIKRMKENQKQLNDAENRPEVLSILKELLEKYYSLSVKSAAFFDSCNIQAKSKKLSDKQIEILKDILG